MGSGVFALDPVDVGEENHWFEAGDYALVKPGDYVILEKTIKKP